ncbi:hypothetical protein I3760_01G055600 [Carya illinoinensis]|nr:hypothetical protein I3760_01G055600 [Carya illinoinensis]
MVRAALDINSFTRFIPHREIEATASNLNFHRLSPMHSIAMEHLDSGSDGVSQVELTEPPLICGLPDDIALLCLARVPRKYHTLLKCVSKRWRDLVCSEKWHSYRQKHKLDETWVYALCRDKFDRACCYVLDPNSSRRCWKPIEGLPPRSVKRKGIGFEVLGKKVYLLGGCSWSEDATNEVYCYDASMSSWSDAAPLSTASGRWQHADADLVSGWRGPAVVLDGTLYVLDQSSGTRLIMWQKETREWVPVGRLSPLLTRPPCQIVAVGKSIFVVGKGLSTVIVDVGNVGNIGGVIITSSIPKLTSDDDVISCKCLAL